MQEEKGLPLCPGQTIRLGAIHLLSLLIPLGNVAGFSNYS